LNTTDELDSVTKSGAICLDYFEVVVHDLDTVPNPDSGAGEDNGECDSEEEHDWSFQS